MSTEVDEILAIDQAFQGAAPHIRASGNNGLPARPAATMTAQRAAWLTSEPPTCLFKNPLLTAHHRQASAVCPVAVPSVRTHPT